MKRLLFTIIMLSVGYSQCDANGDGQLDILDVLDEVNCILEDCWATTNSIYGFWLVDSVNVYGQDDNGQNTNETEYCDDLWGNDPYIFVMSFNEYNQHELWHIDNSFCGLNNVDLTNFLAYELYTFSIDGNNLNINGTDEDGYEQIIQSNIEFVDYNTMKLETTLISEDLIERTLFYHFHRISVNSNNLNTPPFGNNNYLKNIFSNP